MKSVIPIIITNIIVQSSILSNVECRIQYSPRINSVKLANIYNNIRRTLLVQYSYLIQSNRADLSQYESIG